MRIYREVQCTTAEDLVPYQDRDDVFVIENDVICTYSRALDEWHHDDGPAGGAIHFPLWEGDTVIALVPMSVRRETRYGGSLRDRNLHALKQEMAISAREQPLPYVGKAEERFTTSWEPVE